MSAVDVLAVMDADGRAVACVIDSCSPGTLRQKQWEAHLQQHDEARAAVAELIETQRELLLEIGNAAPHVTDVMQKIPSDTLQRATTALARVHPMTREQQAEQAQVRG